MPRPGCYVCLKAPAECICGLVPRVENRTVVHLLQHPRERLHSIGTARIARLGLARVRMEVAPPGLVARPEWRAGIPGAACLLHPDPTAPELAELPATARPRDLVVLDGTWRATRALARANPWLDELPRVRLAPAAPSRYRIRKAPRPQYISTIEAVVTALRILEPETAGFEGLLAAFDAMIDRQIQHMRTGSGRTPSTPGRRRPSSGPRLPAELREPERLVIVYGELHGRKTVASTELDIIQLAAERVASGTCLSVVARPTSGELPDHQPTCAGLPAAILAAGCSQPELLAAWGAFARPNDIVTAWNQSTFTRLAKAGLSLPPQRLLLKGAYCDQHQHEGSPGHLEDAVAARDLPLPPNPFPGRAGHRMACARAMLDYLTALAAAGE